MGKCMNCEYYPDNCEYWNKKRRAKNPNTLYVEKNIMHNCPDFIKMEVMKVKCTIKNLNKVFDLVSEKHLDSIENGADFALRDDESDLLTAVSETIELIKKNKEEQ